MSVEAPGRTAENTGQEASRRASGQEGDTWKVVRRRGVEGGAFQHVSSGVSFGSPGGMKAFIRISFAVSHLTSLGEHLDPWISFSHYVLAFLIRKDLNHQILGPCECWFKYQTPTRARRRGHTSLYSFGCLSSFRWRGLESQGSTSEAQLICFAHICIPKHWDE